MEKYTYKFQKISRIIAIILSCAIAISTTCIAAFAKERNTINKPEINIATVLTTVGKIVDGGQVIIDGKENNLYREFANKNEAITNIIQAITMNGQVAVKTVGIISAVTEVNMLESENNK